MAQCQTNQDGRCLLEPPCPVGECYMYMVLNKEHSEETRAVREDPSVGKELAESFIAFKRGPYTEHEPWERSKLALVNAVLDTLIPGARLVVEAGANPRVSLGKTKAFDRPRDLVRSLREIADCLEGKHYEPR